MRKLFGLFVMFFILATIFPNLVLASNQGVVGMVVLDSPREDVAVVDKAVVLEKSSVDVSSQDDLKEKYDSQELEKELVSKPKFVDQLITGGSVIDLEKGSSGSTTIFVIIVLVIVLLFLLLLWLIFK